MKTVITPLLITLTLMTCTAAYAGLGNPEPGSDQSGIGIVSGFHCDANKIEASFDGGPLIDVPYGSTRNDTIDICGDDDNGFGLLWNYNLLGTGQHRVQVYADGVLFGDRVFTVTTVGAEFLRDRQSSRRVYGFPDLDHDVILNWQQGNQNYLISNYTTSINSFDVAGVWGDTDQSFSISVSPSSSDPDFAQVVIIGEETADYYGFVASGAMQRNIALVSTQPQSWTGYTYIIEFRLEFTEPRKGTVEVIGCSPVSDCANEGVVIGSTIPIVKQFPFEEDAVLPHSDLADDTSEAGGLAEYFYDAYIKAVEELDYLIEGMDDQPLKENYQD